MANETSWARFLGGVLDVKGPGPSLISGGLHDSQLPHGLGTWVGCVVGVIVAIASALYGLWWKHLLGTRVPGQWIPRCRCRCDCDFNPPEEAVTEPEPVDRGIDVAGPIRRQLSLRESVLLQSLQRSAAERRDRLGQERIYHNI